MAEFIWEEEPKNAEITQVKKEAYADGTPSHIHLIGKYVDRTGEEMGVRGIEISAERLKKSGLTGVEAETVFKDMWDMIPEPDQQTKEAIRALVPDMLFTEAWRR